MRHESATNLMPTSPRWRRLPCLFHPLRSPVGTVLRPLCLFTAVWALLADPLPDARREYQRRVNTVRNTRGFVALWDFVRREDNAGGSGRFAAHQRPRQRAGFELDAANYVRDYWGEGRAATYDDFPLLGRGPFGQAIRFRRQEGNDFRPLLLVPRERVHGSGLDAKGPGRSVSMVAWLVREAGNHAIAGIWHEGTDLASVSATVRKVEQGKRQYALFAGLAANNGASAAHVSENGGASFGDRYARNLSTTPEIIPVVAPDASADAIDRAWSVVAFTFDNDRNTVTSFLNGRATEYWIDNPEQHPFFQWPAKGWRQAHLHREPGLQPGEDAAFPRAQFYEPPEQKPLSREVIEDRGEERIELHRFAFTRVRVTLGKDERGRFGRVIRRDLVALRVNPFWFPHDLYHPRTPADGGPFTIGEVIHTSRSQGFIGYLGGLAVFDRALTPADMERLAAIGRSNVQGAGAPDLLRLADLSR